MLNPFEFVKIIETMNEELSSRLDAIINRLDQLIEQGKPFEVVNYPGSRNSNHGN